MIGCPIEWMFGHQLGCPIGCQFAPRCNWQTESCDIMPEISQINETHQVRCHKYEQFFEKYNEKRNS